MPSLPGQRRGVDAEGHAQHRLVDGEAGQRVGVGRVGEGVADLDLGEAGHHEQVAGRRARRPRRGRCPRRPAAGSSLRVSGGWPSAISSSQQRDRAGRGAACRGRPGRWRGGRGSREASRLVTRACSGAPGSPMGAGTVSRMASSSGGEVGVRRRACRRRPSPGPRGRRPRSPGTRCGGRAARGR